MNVSCSGCNVSRTMSVIFRELPSNLPECWNRHHFVRTSECPKNSIRLWHLYRHKTHDEAWRNWKCISTPYTCPLSKMHIRNRVRFTAKFRGSHRTEDISSRNGFILTKWNAYITSLLHDIGLSRKMHMEVGERWKNQPSRNFKAPILLLQSNIMLIRQVRNRKRSQRWKM